MSVCKKIWLFTLTIPQKTVSVILQNLIYTDSLQKKISAKRKKLNLR